MKRIHREDSWHKTDFPLKCELLSSCSVTASVENPQNVAGGGGTVCRKILWVQCWNVCNSVSWRKRMHAVMPSSICLEHDAYVWRCWTYESHYTMRCKAAWCTRTEHILVSCGVRVWRTFAKLPSLVSGMRGLDHSGDSERSLFPFCCLPYMLPGAVLRILLCFFEGDGQTNSVDIQQTRTWEAVVVELGRTNLQEIADTQRPVQEEIYIYIYSFQVFFSQKEKKIWI